MKIRKAAMGIALALAVLSASFALVRMTRAQEQVPDQPEIASKLNRVLDGQKNIMDQLASIRTELSIIKIRVTQQQ